MALLDSGATESFLNKRVAKIFGIPTRELNQAKEVKIVDGTNRGSLPRSLPRPTVRQKKLNLRFFLTNIGRELKTSSLDTPSWKGWTQWLIEGTPPSQRDIPMTAQKMVRQRPLLDKRYTRVGRRRQAMVASNSQL
jgi:hypothetical protein